MLTIPELSLEASDKARKQRAFPGYVWYAIMQHLDLKFVLTRLMRLSVKTREFFVSLNSALFDTFIRSYGLCKLLRRTDLPGRI